MPRRNFTNKYMYLLFSKGSYAHLLFIYKKEDYDLSRVSKWVTSSGHVMCNGYLQSVVS